MSVTLAIAALSGLLPCRPTSEASERIPLARSLVICCSGCSAWESIEMRPTESSRDAEARIHRTHPEWRFDRKGKALCPVCFSIKSQRGHRGWRCR